MLIFLIGFMGSGKSYTGKRLASLLNYDFVDLDDFLEASEKKSITEVFAESGEEGFRELESKYLRTFGKREELIIATGGGAPCRVENLEWMKAQGLIIYLKATPELLAERLRQETNHRPLISGLQKEELLLFIIKKLEQRKSAYESADIIVEQTADTDIADIISQRLYGK